MELRYSKRSVKAIDGMDKSKLFEIARRFVEDDVATEDDLAAIKAAREEYENGETVSHESINWD